MAENTTIAESAEKPQVPQQEPIYAPISSDCMMDAVEGIRFDFNDGLRVQFPDGGGPWRILFRDIDTDTVLYCQDVEPKMQVTSVKKYFVRFHLQIFHKAEIDAMTAPEPLPEPIFEHTFDPTDKLVMVQMPVPTIGDTVGWFPYVEKFRKQNHCRVVAVLDKKFIPLFERTYPEITLITKEQVPEYQPYACYYIGLFFRGDVDHQPCDFRFVGLHRTAGYILGVAPEEERPRFDLSAPRAIKEPYICIAAQSSSQAKYWNNPHGWREVVAFLKEHGYRVLCIDKDHEHGTGIMFNHIPYGCEDFTGALPLQERINLLKDADFFVGVSSGLSWLAWGCGIPVVMISGFTHPTNEFFTPYRVINYHVCNSCWNDPRVEFDHYDFLWCPRHKGDDRQFECSRAISCKQVIDTIQQIPAFQARQGQA